MENLEDAVALFSPSGEMNFSNAAMRALRFQDLPESHPARQLVARTLSTHRSSGRSRWRCRRGGSGGALGALRHRDRPTAAPEGESDTERLLMCHAIEDSNRRFLGAMLVARNVGYLNQVHSTLNYSRKAAAIGRLLAGVAHEVKNPLNAMTIHLELLKQKVGSIKEPIVVPAPGGGPGAAARPGEARQHHLERDQAAGRGRRRIPEVRPARRAEAAAGRARQRGPRCRARRSRRRRIAAASRSGRSARRRLPEINADQGMLMQAVLNLAINALQAMPDGGSLQARRAGSPRGAASRCRSKTPASASRRRTCRASSTCYFTTKEKGSGIGLSMVFRIVQLHDGEVEVQSTPGGGTKFTLFFPQAITQELNAELGQTVEAAR